MTPDYVINVINSLLVRILGVNAVSLLIIDQFWAQTTYISVGLSPIILDCTAVNSKRDVKEREKKDFGADRYTWYITYQRYSTYTLITAHRSIALPYLLLSVNGIEKRKQKKSWPRIFRGFLVSGMFDRLTVKLKDHAAQMSLSDGKQAK